MRLQQQQCWQQQRQAAPGGLCYLGWQLWGGRRPSRRTADSASLSSKVLLGQLASAAANIAAAEAFAAAADFSDGNLGPESTSAVAVPDFEAAGPDMKVARRDFEAAGPDLKVAGPDF